MIRQLNRAIKDYLRPKRLALGKFLFDRKIGVNNPNLENIIVSNNIKSVLFMRYDGKIGDMIVNTLMFRELKKNYPNIKIGVVTRGAAKDILLDSPWVDEIFDYSKETCEALKVAKKINGKYDLLVDFSEMIRVKEMLFINKCNCPYNMGMGKENWNLFNINLKWGEDFSESDHITKRYGVYLKKMGIESYDSSYDIFINSERDVKIKDCFQRLKGKDINNSNNINECSKIENFKENKGSRGICILNPYGASKHKNFNFETIKNIAKYNGELGYLTVLIYSPDKYDELKKFYESAKEEIPMLVLPLGIKSILDSAAIIKYGDFVITPDTSIVHVASAFSKPLISVYPPNGGAYGVDHLVWGPRDSKNPVLFCKESKSSIEKFDINTFSMDEMRKVILNIVRENIGELR